MLLFAQGWEPEEETRAIVCLVHGLGEHSGRYAQVAAALTGAGYTLLAFDLRGHGRSEGRRGHAAGWDALLSDVDCLLAQAEARYPHRARFLYGHSLGGCLVLSYVLRRRPDLSGAIATSPALRPAFEPARWRVALGKALCRVRPGLLMSNGLDRNGLSHDPAVARAYACDPLVHDRLSARLGVDLLAYGKEALANAAQLPLPLLLMHGNTDPICSFAASREFADKASSTGRCTFKEWDGLYHELHNELQQGEVMGTMIGWLDAHLAGEGLWY